MTQSDKPEGDTMAENEIVEFLQSQGHGVLSVGDQSDVYGVPVSFGYTEEEAKKVIYLYLNQFGEGSEKLDLLERTDQASFVVSDVNSRDDWRSAILRGHLKNLGAVGESQSTTETTNEQYIRNVMKDNAWFPSFSDEGDQINESKIFLFVIDEMSGRQSGTYL